MRPIHLKELREWQIDKGALVHHTGGFFSVRGIHVEAPDSMFHDRRLPMIDQPEVGLLGFVVDTGGEEIQWLIQAKSEPGTVDWVQAAPTVQATRSNYTRKHGGERTRFLERFPLNGEGSPTGRLNSEQGNRFLNKFNCNAIVTVSEPFDPEDPDWAWSSAPDVREALALDFSMNTDARSVIATGEWKLLRKNGEPFTGPTWATENLWTFREELARSYSSGRPSSNRFEALLSALGRFALARLSAGEGLARLCCRTGCLSRVPSGYSSQMALPEPWLCSPSRLPAEK